MRLGLLSVAALLLSCASTQPPDAPVGGEAASIVWPRGAAPERIRFVATFSGPEDLGIRASGVRRLMDAIAGKRELGMVRPYAVAVQKQTIAVTDPGARLVHVFDRVRGRYQAIAKAGDDTLRSPVGVALGAEKIFVSDSALGKIFILDGRGRHIHTIEGLERPTGLAFDAASERLYAAETLGHRIAVFDISGKRVFQFGSRGSNPGEFNFPSHLHLSGESLLVNDNMNFRVQIFDRAGQFVSLFGSHGDGSGHLSQPKGVAADSFGHIYVAGATIDRVQVFSATGDFLLAFGSEGSRPGQFLMPAGLCILDDLIYVADSYNSRIQIFQYVGGD